MLKIIVVALLWAAPAFAQAEFLTSYHWTNDDPRLGGVSGIVVSDDGVSFDAIIDRGLLLHGTMTRDAQDALTGVTITSLTASRDADGAPLVRAMADSEGLARMPDGQFAVSFENIHRVDTCALIATLPVHPDFSRIADMNEGLEALAGAWNGTLFTLPEEPQTQFSAFPVYRFDGTSWDIAFRVRKRGAFLVSGADIGPDGKLYLLERAFGIIGFRSRVRRFDLDGGGEEEVLASALRQHDNLEGISVWRDMAGDLRITMVSDDNFLPVQRTEIVEYRLTD